MTQKTNRLHISTRTVAMVLSIVMLIGSIATGSMLNTFAAYLNNAAKADAVAQAATEGGAIALNAIPSEDTDDADAKPDLSGFTENDLVRSIKADAVGTDADAAPISREKKDPAGTGANADLAPTGWAKMVYKSSLDWSGGWKWVGDGNSGSVVIASGLKKGESIYYYFGGTDKTSWESSTSDGFTAYGGQNADDPVSEGNGYKLKYGSTNCLKYTVKDSGILKLTISQSGSDFYGYIDEVRWQLNQGVSTDHDSWHVLPNHYNMTVSSTSATTFTYKMDLTAGTKYYFDVRRDLPGSSHTYDYYKSATTLSLGTAQTLNKYNTSSADKSNFTPSTTGSYTLTWTATGDYPSTGTLKITKDTVEYYLTGYINGGDVKTTQSTYKFNGTSSPYTFTLNSTKATQWITIADSAGNAYHPATHGAGSGVAYSTKDTGVGEDKKWKVDNANGKTITFTWTGTTLSWVVSSGGTIDVYAKDGAAPIDWDHKDQGGATGTSGTAYNYAIIGTTTVTSSGVTFTNNTCGDSSSAYKFGTVPVGQTINVSTTIGSPYNSTYYVAGWCVNGITYKNGTNTVGVNDKSTTAFSFTYTLPSDTEGMLEDVAGYPVVEITPIYYRKDKTDTVTFFIEGYTDVQSKWGNTPYAYPFYGDLSGYQNTFGAYPGQPVVNVGGQMSIEIPIKSKAISNKTADNTVIKGVTVNNGYADHVHRNLVYGWNTGSNVNDDKDHMQTYDFDDFYKIYAEHTDTKGNHPNQIFFRFKEETKTYNRYTYGGGNSGQFANSNSNITATQISTINNNNGWELLKDRHDRPVNIFGDYDAVKNTSQGSTASFNSNALYVISTGYNANIAGDYGTMWKIYDGSNGNLITKDATNARYGIPPSLLHIQGSTSGMSSNVSYPSANRSVVGVGSYTDSNAKYNNVYKALKAAEYNNKVVYITYEKDTQDTRNVATGEGAYRADGQWFYTFATDEVQSTIGIEYYNRATGTWTADTVSAAGVGTTTKATAAFNSGSYDDAATAATSKKYLTSDNATWNFTATESGTDNKYAFSGWYLKYDDTYEHISGSTTSGSIKATANYRLIARYVPVVTNSLVITHKLDPESTGTGTATMTVKYNNATQTVNYVNGVATAEINVSWENSAKNIDVTLTATPQNDGRVQSISLDDQISTSTYTVDTTDYPLPCTTDNQAVTRTLRFTDHDVYNSEGTSLVITELDYVSKLNATPHYYQFTYTFKDRSGATKNYTARGEITEDHYAEYVNSSHQVSDAFVKSRAPFESNFLKTLKLDTDSNPIAKGYTPETHTFTASATYKATAYTPIYDVKIKLPYDYYTSAGGSGVTAYKMYTANSSTYNERKPAFTLKANYDTFVTNDATSTKAGTSTKVSKVTDSTDVNHTGNDFITAADKLGNKYFRYWEIKRLADTESAQSSAPVIARIYYPDLHYRFYADSYVEAVYTDNEAEYWSNVNGNNTELSASVLYLESSRNQYNTVANDTSDKTADAADIIYNDFIFNYRLGDKEFISSTDAEIGMVLERVKSSDGTKWVTGDSSVTNMDSYKAANAGTENKTAIQNWLKNGGTAPKGCVKQQWNNNELNNKNFTEQNYPAYAQYGQTVSDHSITFKNDGTMDNYVYRAWAYIKDSNGNVAVSDPAYFSMNYIAAQNYKAG